MIILLAASQRNFKNTFYLVRSIVTAPGVLLRKVSQCDFFIAVFLSTSTELAVMPAITKAIEEIEWL